MTALSAGCRALGLPTFLTLLCLVTAAADARPWQINLDESTLRFRVGYVDGMSLSARFPTFSGMLEFEPDQPVSARADIKVDGAAIQTGLFFINDLVRSEAYLHTDAFPDIRFLLTEFARTSPSSAELTGEITVRGITRPITFDAILRKWVKTEPQRLIFDISGMLDRRDFGMVADLDTVATQIPVTIRLTLDAK